MLQTIRERTQGWIAGVIISIIILSFALWGIHSYFVSGGNNTNVAEVNGVDISREQLNMAFERLRRQVQAQYGSNNPAIKDESLLKSKALQNLIEIEVLKQASIKQGFQVFDRQIDSYLQGMPEFQVDGRFSVERFQQILSATMLNTGEFLEIIRTSLLIDQPKLGVIFTSFALPDESNNTIALVNQERNIDYVTIPMQYFLSQPIAVSQDKVKAYYEAHKQAFMTPEQVSVDYIELSLNDLISKMNPTDAELNTFYSENVNTYTQPMMWKMADIVVPLNENATPEEINKAQEKATAIAQELEKGADFNKLARANTQSTSGQEWVTLNQVAPEMQKTVGGLTKAGDISTPMQTTKGFVIVKVLDVKEPQIQSFASVKDKVKEAYVRQQAEEKFAQMRDQLADITYEHPDSLQLAAKNLDLPIKTSALFTKDKAGKDISESKKIRDIAFSNDVLNLQNNSDVIQLNPETVVVLRAKSHVASTLLPLTNVSKQIEDQLKSEDAESRAVKFTTELKDKLQTSTNPQAVLSQYKLTAQQAGYIGRYSNKVNPAIVDAAFSLANPATQNGKPVYGMAKLQNGYAIIVLKEVKSGAITDQKQYSVFAEQVQNSEGLLEYELYKQSQINNAKITIEKN